MISKTQDPEIQREVSCLLFRMHCGFQRALWVCVLGGKVSTPLETKDIAGPFERRRLLVGYPYVVVLLRIIEIDQSIHRSTDIRVPAAFAFAQPRLL